MQLEARAQLAATLLLLCLWAAMLGTRSLILHWLLPSILGAPIIGLVQLVIPEELELEHQKLLFKHGHVIEKLLEMNDTL